MDFALRKGDLVLAEYSIKHGSDVNERYTTGETPWYEVYEELAGVYELEVLEEYLIEKLGTINYNKKTPLHIACENGNEAIVKYLVGCGAKKNGPVGMLPWRGSNIRSWRG